MFKRGGGDGSRASQLPTPIQMTVAAAAGAPPGHGVLGSQLFVSLDLHMIAFLDP